jgi:hypothetical protein
LSVKPLTNTSKNTASTGERKGKKIENTSARNNCFTLLHRLCALPIWLFYLSSYRKSNSPWLHLRHEASHIRGYSCGTSLYLPVYGEKSVFWVKGLLPKILNSH